MSVHGVIIDHTFACHGFVDREIDIVYQFRDIAFDCAHERVFVLTVLEEQKRLRGHVGCRQITFDETKYRMAFFVVIRKVVRRTERLAFHAVVLEYRTAFTFVYVGSGGTLGKYGRNGIYVPVIVVKVTYGRFCLVGQKSEYLFG